LSLWVLGAFENPIHQRTIHSFAYDLQTWFPEEINVITLPAHLSVHQSASDLSLSLKIFEPDR